MSSPKSLKHLLISYLCVTIVVIMLVGLCSLYVIHDLYINQTAEDLQVRARLCSNPIAELLRQEDTDAVDALCKELGEDVNTRITVIRPNGQVIGDTEKDPKSMENHADRPEIRQVLDDPSEVGSSTRHSTTLEETMMYVAVAVREDGSTAAVVRTSIPITTLTQRLYAAYRVVLTAGVVGAMLAVAAIPYFTIRLKRLTTDTKHERTGPSTRLDDRPQLYDL